MPVISEFNGIKIIMWPLEDSMHNPHFHAFYGECAISFDLTTREITGEMPANKMMDIIIWANKYRSQLTLRRLKPSDSQATHAATRYVSA